MPVFNLMAGSNGLGFGPLSFTVVRPYVYINFGQQILSNY